MERISIIEAREMFGKSFIGKEELIAHVPFLDTSCFNEVPEIPYSRELLDEYRNDYMLILGISTMKDGQDISLLSLRNFFGIDPAIKEPCFYNQDWYFQEAFTKEKLDIGWILIKKNIINETRARSPNEFIEFYHFPKAIQCAYTFFVSWFCCDIVLWEQDFVWCIDVDHNNDRIYVGKYRDVDSLNKNGFSIHRHLSIRNCYGGINCIK